MKKNNIRKMQKSWGLILWSLKQIAQGSKLTEMKKEIVNSDKTLEYMKMQVQFQPYKRTKDLWE